MTVEPLTPLKEVARLMVERRISGVPVVDVDGTVVGVVSEGDILVKERDRQNRRPCSPTCSSGTRATGSGAKRATRPTR